MIRSGKIELQHVCMRRGGEKERRREEGNGKGTGISFVSFRPSPPETWRTGQDGLPGRMVSMPSVLLKR